MINWVSHRDLQPDYLIPPFLCSLRSLWQNCICISLYSTESAEEPIIFQKLPGLFGSFSTDSKEADHGKNLSISTGPGAMASMKRKAEAENSSEGK